MIIEAIPRKDRLHEGRVLNEFMRMSFEKVVLNRISYKKDLLTMLDDTRMINGFNYVHLSGHGDVTKKKAAFKCPYGWIVPDEFPCGCFEDRTVALSGCQLGKTAFIEPFMNQTEARNVIAPQRDVPFVDAAVWFVNFYYFALHHEKSSWTAFEMTNQHLRGRALGAFKFWNQG